MIFDDTNLRPMGAVSLSARAKDYLDTARPQTVPTETLDRHTAELIRAGRRAVTHEVRDSLANQYSLSISDAVISGVAVKVIEPKLSRDDATVLYLHGGAFVFGEPDDIGSLLIAHHTERRVISVNYRLAPEHPFPSGLDDCRAVVRAIGSERNDYAMIGMSAGATLAASALLAEREHMAHLPTSLTLLTPASDFTNFGDSIDFNDGRDPVLTWQNQLDIALKAYVGDHDISDPLISPIFGDYDPQWPNTLIVTGTRDLLLSSCVRLSRAMKAKQAPVVLSVWDGMWHGFNYVPDLPEALECWAEIKSFVI